MHVDVLETDSVHCVGTDLKEDNKCLDHHLLCGLIITNEDKNM